MKKSQIIPAAFFLISVLVSCQSKNKEIAVVEKRMSDDSPDTPSQKPIVEEFKTNDLTKNFLTYWTYHSQYVKLFKDFVPLDTGGKVIAKVNFLKELAKGLYFPLLHSTKDSICQYKLVSLPTNLIKDAGPVIADYSKHQLSNFYKEKKLLPYFKFKDINRVEYSSSNTKGKILVLKCWFIACQPCVAEMPELNRMVQKYKDRKDILFLSLASDDKESLKRFLRTTKFDYHVVPNQDVFMSQKLKVYAYPTHILIDKQGKIVKIVNDAADLEKLLSKAK